MERTPNLLLTRRCCPFVRMRSPSASIFMRGHELDNSGHSGYAPHDGMRARPPLALPAIRAAKMELLSPPFAHARSCTADRLHGCSGGCGRGPSAGGTSLVPRLSTCSRARPVAGRSSDGGASFRRASGMRLGGVLCCTLQGPARALRASLHSAARFVSRACCDALGHVQETDGGGVLAIRICTCMCLCGGRAIV